MKRLSALVLLAAAATAAPPALVINGHVDEPFWGGAAPHSLGPGGGDVRAAVAGGYLYVAATLSEPGGRVTARSVGRNPVWENQDTLRIAAGGRILLVNPFGAYSVEQPGPVVLSSAETYPYEDERRAPVVERNAEKFLVAAAVGLDAWTVEAALPLRELNLPRTGNVMVNVERIRAIRPASPEMHWSGEVEAPRLGPVNPVLRPDGIGNRENPLVVTRVGSVPALQKGWDDAPWSRIPAWHLLRDDAGALTPRFPTAFKVVRDGRGLSVLALLTEPGAPVANATHRDEPLSRDDSFQLYLTTTGSSYVQIGVNAAGALYDVAGKTGSLREARPAAWNSGAPVSAKRGDGAWTVRVDIPLEAVANALGESGVPSRWRVLFIRQRPGRGGEPAEKSVLPVVRSENALCPLRYRRLALGEGEGSALPVPVQAADDRVLSPAEKALDVSGMLRKQQQRRVLDILEVDRREWGQVGTRQDWERYRDRRVGSLRASLGRFPERVPLTVRVVKEHAGSGYRRQDLVYQSRAGV